jgi:hypothetical protein
VNVHLPRIVTRSPLPKRVVRSGNCTLAELGPMVRVNIGTPPTKALAVEDSTGMFRILTSTDGS